MCIYIFRSLRVFFLIRSLRVFVYLFFVSLFDVFQRNRRARTMEYGKIGVERKREERQTNENNNSKNISTTSAPAAAAVAVKKEKHQQSVKNKEAKRTAITYKCKIQM